MKLKYQNKTETLIIEISLKYKNNNLNQPVFSASGHCYSGQGLDCIPEFVKTMENKREIKELIEIYELWKEWHLNDKETWCSHMNYGNFPKTEIKMHKLVGNEEYEKLSKIRKLPSKYIIVSEQGLVNIPRALYGYASYDIKQNKHIESKSNGWLTYDPVFCPEGLIGRECPICGKKYGHEWFYRPIPKNALKKIKNIINK